MKIAILTICTGKYTIFFKQLYESCKTNFLQEDEKTFFVFTDGEIESSSDVVRIEQRKLGWPLDTMMRFSMFNRISDKLLEYDYIFFLNANMVVSSKVGSEIIPNEENDYLVGVAHPGFHGEPKERFTYERNKSSNFYIPFEEGKVYFQGCFNGGRSKEFLEMSKQLDVLIYDDLKKNHVPLWHDESALNWYYSKRNPKSLPPSYAYPEVAEPDYEKKIIQLDKTKHGGHDFLRK
jgi:hypothetical protein